jgi:hypothetical protein
LTVSEETKRRPRAAADATYQQVKYESVLAQRDALSARVAELEAVVRAADEMRAKADAAYREGAAALREAGREGLCVLPMPHSLNARRILQELTVPGQKVRFRT